jgi:hypothetical protein
LTSPFSLGPRSRSSAGLAAARHASLTLSHQINEQIVLYVMSRTLLSLLPRLYKTTSTPPLYPTQPLYPLPNLTSPEANPRPIPPAPLPFALVSALSWAGVMYMFRHRGERLQPGLSNSMRESWSGARRSREQRSKAKRSKADWSGVYLCYTV